MPRITILKGDLPCCPECQLPPICEKRANGSFRIRCQCCEYKTPWETKIEAIIDWFQITLKGYSYLNAIKRRAKAKTPKE